MAIGEPAFPIAPAPPTALAPPTAHGHPSPAARGEVSDMEIEAARAGDGGSASRRSTMAGGRDSLPLVDAAGGRLSLGGEGVKAEEGMGMGMGMEDDVMMGQDDDFRMDDDDYPPPPPEEQDGVGAGAGLSPSKLEGEEELLEEGEEEGLAAASPPAARAGGEGEGGEEVAFVWHPNTVKILLFLRRQIKGKRAVSLKKLAAEASRTNVAKFFWELLQLKTWDFITLEQRDAYGDILIGPGRRFRDEIVAAAGNEDEEGEGETGDDDSEAVEAAA
jgi:hypothetical protein